MKITKKEVEVVKHQSIIAQLLLILLVVEGYFSFCLRIAIKLKTIWAEYDRMFFQQQQQKKLLCLVRGKKSARRGSNKE